MGPLDLSMVLPIIRQDALAIVATAQALVGDGSHFLASTSNLFGYVAAGLVFATFCMQRMVPLRVMGICSNVAFLTYGLMLDLKPIAVLHAVLLPVNIRRLWQARRQQSAPRGPLAAAMAAEAASAVFRQDGPHWGVRGGSLVALAAAFVCLAGTNTSMGHIECPLEQTHDWNQYCRSLAQLAVPASDHMVRALARAGHGEPKARHGRPHRRTMKAQLRTRRSGFWRRRPVHARRYRTLRTKVRGRRRAGLSSESRNAW